MLVPDGKEDIVSSWAANVLLLSRMRFREAIESPEFKFLQYLEVKSPIDVVVEMYSRARSRCRTNGEVSHSFKQNLGALEQDHLKMAVD